MLEVGLLVAGGAAAPDVAASGGAGWAFVHLSGLWIYGAGMVRMGLACHWAWYKEEKFTWA